MRWHQRLFSPVGEGLSSTGRLVVRTAVLSLVGLAAIVVAIAIAGFQDLRGLIGGTLIAWGGGTVSWAVLHARHRHEDVSRQIRHHAEYDVLHMRLNDIAEQVGAPVVDTAGQLERMVNAREAMVAHWTGLEELRGE